MAEPGQEPQFLTHQPCSFLCSLRKGSEEGPGESKESAFEYRPGQAREEKGSRAPRALGLSTPQPCHCAYVESSAPRKGLALPPCTSAIAPLLYQGTWDGPALQEAGGPGKAWSPGARVAGAGTDL